MTYDYECTNCSDVKEIIHGMKESPEIKCDLCGSVCKRVMSGGSFILKGSGWPSQEIRMKGDMGKKNTRMAGKMTERNSSGQGVTKLSQLSKTSL